MGKINKITCRGCGKNWEYRSGCGIMHNSLNVIANLFEDTMAEQIKMHAKEKKYMLFDFAFELAQCSSCRSIVDVPFLELKGEQYMGDCPLCGHKVEMLTDIAKLKCPICNGVDFEQSTIGHWD